MRREIKLMMMIKMAEPLKCFVKLVFNKENGGEEKKSKGWAIRRGQKPCQES